MQTTRPQMCEISERAAAEARLVREPVPWRNCRDKTPDLLLPPDRASERREGFVTDTISPPKTVSEHLPGWHELIIQVAGLLGPLQVLLLAGCDPGN